MALSMTTLIIIGVVAWALKWFYNLPIPRGYKNPWILRLIFTFMRLVDLRNWVLGFFYDEVDVMLKIMRSAKPISKKPDLPVECRDAIIAGIKVRFYCPTELSANNNPAIIFFHGGGWICGNIELYNSFCITMADKVKAVVVSVEYRLAPENPYPAPMEDSVAVTRYLLEHPEEYGLDASRIALIGESAGSNLAAATALKLRDMKVKPQPKLQVLVYPCLQAIDFNSPSFQLNQNHVILPRKRMATFWLLYATGKVQHRNSLITNQHTSPSIKEKFYQGKLAHDLILTKYESKEYVPNKIGFGCETLWEKFKPVFMDPYFAPLMAEDFSDLPEALIFTVQDDVLRDDGVWYSEHLKSGGTPVTHHHHMSGYHGMVPLIANLADHVEARRIIFDWLKTKL